MAKAEDIGTSLTTDEELEIFVSKLLSGTIDEGKEAVQATMQSIMKCLVANETVHIRKFGTFHLKKRKASRAKGLDGKPKIQSSYWMIRFKPSPKFRNYVSKMMVTN